MASKRQEATVKRIVETVDPDAEYHETGDLVFVSYTPRWERGRVVNGQFRANESPQRITHVIAETGRLYGWGYGAPPFPIPEGEVVTGLEEMTEALKARAEARKPAKAESEEEPTTTTTTEEPKADAQDRRRRLEVDDALSTDRSGALPRGRHHRRALLLRATSNTAARRTPGGLHPASTPNHRGLRHTPGDFSRLAVGLLAECRTGLTSGWCTHVCAFVASGRHRPQAECRPYIAHPNVHRGAHRKAGQVRGGSTLLLLAGVLVAEFPPTLVVARLPSDLIRMVAAFKDRQRIRT